MPTLPVVTDKPHQRDLDRCVHCGLCLQACPTYRELGVEMDSPRGRIYQMNQVAQGAPITPDYREHIGLCLACRACETACPSGVEYGKLIEAARAQIEAEGPQSGRERLIKWFVFRHLLPSPALLTIAGAALWAYQCSGARAMLRATGLLRLLGLADREQLAPAATPPFFFSKIGRTFSAHGDRRYRVAFLAGCIANVCFSRLNEATVRVLQRNGCEVVIPHGQTCCGALAVHSGARNDARRLARCNIDAINPGDFDAIISNAAGCGSTLKEYALLLEDDRFYALKAVGFEEKVRDITEFLISIPLTPPTKSINARVTYQDSCHLAHGQKIKAAPRELLRAIPGIDLREMPMADLCCGSAGIYNVIHTGMALQILETKMSQALSVEPEIIATANPGCMLQLEAGVRKWGRGQRVMHVVELLDEAYTTETIT